MSDASLFHTPGPDAGGMDDVVRLAEVRERAGRGWSRLDDLRWAVRRIDHLNAEMATVAALLPALDAPTELIPAATLWGQRLRAAIAGGRKDDVEAAVVQAERVLTRYCRERDAAVVGGDPERRMAKRRNIAGMKVIAREFHDANGNPLEGKDYPAWVHELGDILVGLKDDEINASLPPLAAQPPAPATVGEAGGILAGARLIATVVSDDDGQTIEVERAAPPAQPGTGEVHIGELQALGVAPLDPAVEAMRARTQEYRDRFNRAEQTSEVADVVA